MVIKCKVHIKMCSLPTLFFSVLISKQLFFIDYLRVIIVAETFSEGVMVYFQLSDLCKEQEEGNERM